MVHVETSKVIEAPREFVYSELFDYKTLPIASTIVNFTKILTKEGNVQLIEEQGVLLGMKFKAIVKATLSPPLKVVEEFSGDLIGTRVWNLTEVTKATKVTLVSDVDPRGFFARIFAGLTSVGLQRVINEEVEALKSYVEAARSA